MVKEPLKDMQLTWLSLQKVLDEIQSSLDEEARQMTGPWTGVEGLAIDAHLHRASAAGRHDGLAAMQFYLTRAGSESCARSDQLINEMPEDLFIVC